MRRIGSTAHERTIRTIVSVLAAAGGDDERSQFPPRRRSNTIRRLSGD